MKKCHCLGWLVMIAAAGCTAPASQPSPELAARAAAWENLFNAGDIDALMALYTEDSRVLPPNAELGQGLDAVRAGFEELMATGLKGELETVEAMVAGDIGYRLGVYRLKTPEGEDAERGKFIETWQRVNGEWKIRNDIWNTDMPASWSGATLSITHEVEDADRWLEAWQGADNQHALFARHGANRVRVFQNSDQPNLTGLVIEVDNMEAFQAFMDSQEATSSKAEYGVKDATLRVFTEVK